MSEQKRLSVGDPAPDFRLPDSDGNQVALADFRGQHVVVYFYPAASTPGCTKQACDFRDNLGELNDAGFTVLGISPDKPAKLAKFVAAEGLTFPLLSDESREVLDQWGAYGEKQQLRPQDHRRHPVHVRDRSRGQDRTRDVQRPGHRSRRQTPQGSQGLKITKRTRKTLGDNVTTN